LEKLKEASSVYGEMKQGGKLTLCLSTFHCGISIGYNVSGIGDARIVET